MAVRGILLALLAFATFAVHDVVIKYVGAQYSPVQVVFFSTLFAFPLVTLMLIRDSAPGTLRPVNPGWVALRTIVVVVNALCAFYAFSTLPLAQTYAILFAMPLMVTVLSIPILGEKVGIHRWAAVILGLLGVLIVLRPGSADLQAGHAAALTAATFSALASVILRRIGKQERTVVIMLYPLLANVMLLGAALPLVYQPMPIAHLGLFAVIAVFGFSAGMMMIGAYRAAEAAIVAPMQYSQIIWATIFGTLLFGETTDRATFIGAGCVIASGLYIVFREARSTSSTTPVLRSRQRSHSPWALRVSPFLKRRP